MDKKNIESDIEGEDQKLDKESYESEIDYRQNAIFWDSLGNLDCDWTAIIKLFIVRFAISQCQVHWRKHPDEIQQNIEISYWLIYKQTSKYPDGIQLMPTWEWWNGYNVRSFIYPMWLALPGFVLKLIEWDTNFLLVNSMYFMHVLQQIVGDYYQFVFIKAFLGKREAVIMLICIIFNQQVNDFTMRTSSNAVEGNIVFFVFYQFIQLKPNYFDQSTLMMMVGLVLSFIIRSSSLIMYFPLFLQKAVENPKFIFTFIFAAFIIALPLLLLSILVDSFFYNQNKIIIPQLNFVWINIVDKLSEYFGIMPFYYYFENFFLDICENTDLIWISFFFLTLQQITGNLEPSNSGLIRSKETKVGRFPFLFIYIFFNLTIHSIIAHKEYRFLTPVYLLGQIIQTYIFCNYYYLRSIILILIKPIFKQNSKYGKKLWYFTKYILGKIIKVMIFYMLIRQEIRRFQKYVFQQQQKYDNGIDAYNLFTGRSFSEQPESVFFVDKFMQPAHLYLHSNRKDYPYANLTHQQTVVMYEAFRVPQFVPFRLSKELQNGNLKLFLTPSQYFKNDSLRDISQLNDAQLKEYYIQKPGFLIEPWVQEGLNNQLVRLIDQINTLGEPLPQYLFLHHDEDDALIFETNQDYFFQLFENIILRVYDKVDGYFYWKKMKKNEVLHRNLYKLKAEYEFRMIKKGYKDCETKSFGKYIDIERSFHGYTGPLTTQNNINYK